MFRQRLLLLALACLCVSPNSMACIHGIPLYQLQHHYPHNVLPVVDPVPPPPLAAAALVRPPFWSKRRLVHYLILGTAMLICVLIICELDRLLTAALAETKLPANATRAPETVNASTPQ